ncbi:LysR family substrate-binding domain-containing protein [Streptomyces sp. HPF1205]|uniref:LysR family substrate-binding domain-containing protein n=1 Tax=Streptomyces sp. HPF1205 TaxID=2873262 RepID=UPI0027DF0AB0|nr:LysR family substrate-binding domain-containing protein [Streptomyces sp. HPF1205]
MEPTPLGARAQDILGPAYEALLAAYAETRAIAQGVTGALCVGFLGGLNGPEFTDLVTAFAERHPACEVTTLEVPITDFYGALRRGDADVVLTLLPVAEPDLTAGHPLAEYERTAAVPLGHPLAGHPAIGVEDLAGSVVLCGPPELPEAFRRSYFPAATPQGRPVDRRPGGRTYQETFNMVAAGDAVTITHTGIARHYRHPGVVYRPLLGLPPARAALVRRTAADNPAVRAFTALARTRAALADPAGRARAADPRPHDPSS